MKLIFDLIFSLVTTTKMYQSSSAGMRKMDKMVLCLLFLCVNLFAFNAANPGYEDTDDDNGGHSTEFRPMGYEWNIAELEYGHDMLNKIYSLSKIRSDFPTGIRAIGNRAEKAEFDAEFYKFYKALPEILKTLQARLERVLKDNGIIGVVTGRIKTLSSLSEKMEKDGIKDYRKITDIVGARVTFQTIDDISKFKRAYLQAFNKTVDEIRCYGVCGPAIGSFDQRERIYWPWKGSGYRRLHLKVFCYVF